MTVAEPEPVADELRFAVGGVRCAASLWRPSQPAAASRPGPIVVLAHGIAGTRAMRLDAYARRFADAGIAALTFDYRGFGESEGSPRRVIDVRSQLEDWRAAIAFARSLPDIDPGRVAIWGSSFGGGHVLTLAAEHQPVVAAIAQGPFTDGIASVLRLDPRSTLRLAPRAIADQWRALRGRAPVTVLPAGPVGSAALMSAPDAAPGYAALAAYAATDSNEPVAARLGLHIGRYRPGRHLRKIDVPTLIQICTPDSVAPDTVTRRHIRRAANPQITARSYDHGHFAIYFGEPFEQLVADQVAFLQKVLS